MNWFFKTSVLRIFIATLPIQGLAAVVNMSCWPAHHADAETAVVVAASHVDLPVLTATASYDPATVLQITDQVPDTHPHQHARCSACASCCVGASAPPSAPSLAATYDGSQPITVAVTIFTASFISAGLDRPPRPISA